MHVEAAFSESSVNEKTIAPATVPRRTVIVVMDDPESESEHQRPSRRRGRPPGAKGRTISAGRQLSSEDFSFLRARVQGIAPAIAARQYLPEMDAGQQGRYETELKERLRLAASNHELSAELEDLVGTAFGPLVAPSSNDQLQAVLNHSKPTLEEFAQQFPEDMYSEAELIEEYENFDWGPEPSSLSPTSDTPRAEIRPIDRVDALLSLQQRLLRAIEPTDPLHLWFDPAIATALAVHRVRSVKELAVWIRKAGASWYKGVEGVGRARAKRITAWLASNDEFTGLAKHPALCDPLLADHTEGNRLAPLEELEWPVHLLGEAGEFRGPSSNTLHATNDREAVFGWIGALTEKSPATQTAYRRAIERLVLWSLLERGKPISSLSSQDVMDFKNFLRNPPPYWCETSILMKSSAAWRPLRGRLGDQSIELTMSAVNKKFKDWRSSDYLGADAAALVGTSSRRDMKMDVMRSFSDQDLEVIGTTLNQMADTPQKRRLRAILLLLQTAGLRRFEACSPLCWKSVHALRDGNRLTGQYAITIKGKGNRERVLPIQLNTIEALNAHYQDRMALIAKGKLSYYSGMTKEETPLLSILDERLAMRSSGTEGDAPHNAARGTNQDGGISPGRLYALLKEFFLKADANSDGSGTFIRASTHWLRHTYAHQVLLASGNDLTVVQQLLGHADISTSAIYAKADMAKRLEAVQGIKPAV